MELMDYIKPELVVLIPVLYLIGAGLKKAQAFKDELIPIALAAVGIVLSALWLISTGAQGIAMLIFTAIVQGILVAGAAVFANQVYKQARKEDK